MNSLKRGSLVWTDLDPVLGREQAGRRPALIVASTQYLEQADTLAIIVPVTTKDRGWPNHVLLRGEHLGLTRPSYAMTEQIRTITRDRFRGVIGSADASTMKDVDMWLRDFLGLYSPVS